MSVIGGEATTACTGTGDTVCWTGASTGVSLKASYTTNVKNILK